MARADEPGSHGDEMDFGTELHYAAYKNKLEDATRLLRDHPEMATGQDDNVRLAPPAPRRPPSHPANGILHASPAIRHRYIRLRL